MQMNAPYALFFVCLRVKNKEYKGMNALQGLSSEEREFVIAVGLGALEKTKSILGRQSYTRDAPLPD
jgi:hypothetical protein